MQHKTLTKAIQAIIQITRFNPRSMYTLSFKLNIFVFGL